MVFVTAERDLETRSPARLGHLVFGDEVRTRASSIGFRCLPLQIPMSRSDPLPVSVEAMTRTGPAQVQRARRPPAPLTSIIW